MGDKITAKETVKKLGIPVVPGSDGDIKNIDEAKRIAKQIGYPILIKAASGGGGRGMKIAKDESEINEAFVMAKTEAKAAFSDDTVYIEKYLQKPRHIEIQVFGDSNGNAVYLGERDCSLQRRNQKILEEAPSPIITEAQREKIGNISAKAISDLRYEGAGTIEFLFENNEFYFIEMNTRLQVEHPVTEMITGLDLVKEQINIASGKDLSFKQDDINYKGHAIECRINSENPRTFIPSAGKVEFYHPPGGLGIRIDSAVYTGYSVPPYYDSLIGKLIIVADNRVECLSRLKRALDEFVIEGIETTIPLFRELIQNEDIIKGDYDIHWLEKYLSEDA
tara:strand:- start:1838 stop:2845 length:1008 start_codon:yes stop_codon:yes gene_type:complete